MRILRPSQNFGFIFFALTMNCKHPQSFIEEASRFQKNERYSNERKIHIR